MALCDLPARRRLIYQFSEDLKPMSTVPNAGSASARPPVAPTDIAPGRNSTRRGDLSNRQTSSLGINETEVIFKRAAIGAAGGLLVGLAAPSAYAYFGAATGIQVASLALGPCLGIGFVVGGLLFAGFAYFSQRKKVKQRDVEDLIERLRREIAASEHEDDYIALNKILEDNSRVCREMGRNDVIAKLRIDLYVAHTVFLQNTRDTPAVIEPLPAAFATAQTDIENAPQADHAATLRRLSTSLIGLAPRQVINVAAFYSRLARLRDNQGGKLIGRYCIDADRTTILLRQITVLRAEHEITPVDSTTI
jgi:hypothetical protein